MGMVEPSCRPGFGPESTKECEVGGQRRLQDLDRYLALEANILGQEHVARRATANANE